MTILQNSATFYSGVLIGDETRTGTAPSPTLVNGAPVAAAMEIQSTQGGLMLPRMTTAQIAALQNMGTGQLIFNTDTNTPVSIVNGASSGMMIKHYQYVVVGSANIIASFGAYPNFTNVTIASGTNQAYYPMALAGTVSVTGTPFTATTADVDIEVAILPPGSALTLKYLSLENIGVFRNLNPTPVAINATVMAHRGESDGGMLPPLTAANQLILRLRAGNGAAFTGGDATTTLTVDVFYI